MWLSVGFPACPVCGDDSNQCYHRNCPSGGKEPMEINSDTSAVRCPSCDRSWNIMDSNYFCTCGNVFTATEVQVEVEAIIANARLIAQELKRTANIQARIGKMASEEIARTAEETIKRKFGQKIWDTIKSWIPTIVKIVKEWLKC